MPHAHIKRSRGIVTSNKVQTIDGSNPNPPHNNPPAAHRLIPRCDREAIARKFFDRSQPGSTKKLGQINKFSITTIEWCARDYHHEQVNLAYERGLAAGRREVLADVIHIRRAA